MSTEKLTMMGHLKALAQRLQNTRTTISQLAQATTAAIDELDQKVNSLTDGDTVKYGDGVRRCMEHERIRQSRSD